MCDLDPKVKVIGKKRVFTVVPSTAALVFIFFDHIYIYLLTCICFRSVSHSIPNMCHHWWNTPVLPGGGCGAVYGCGRSKGLEFSSDL